MQYGFTPSLTHSLSAWLVHKTVIQRWKSWKRIKLRSNPCQRRCKRKARRQKAFSTKNGTFQRSQWAVSLFVVTSGVASSPSSGFFFWTMLRASLQLWQSLSCASFVIVDNGTKRKGQGQWQQKQTKPNKKPQSETQEPNKKQTVPDQSSQRWNKVKQAQALTANYNPRLSQRLQQEIVKGQCSV